MFLPPLWVGASPLAFTNSYLYINHSLQARSQLLAEWTLYSPIYKVQLLFHPNIHCGFH